MLIVMVKLICIWHHSLVTFDFWKRSKQRTKTWIHHLVAAQPSNDYYIIAKLLIDNGANIYAKNAKNQTPLDLAENEKSTTLYSVYWHNTKTKNPCLIFISISIFCVNDIFTVIEELLKEKRGWIGWLESIWWLEE